MDSRFRGNDGSGRSRLSGSRCAAWSSSLGRGPFDEDPEGFALLAQGFHRFGVALVGALRVAFVLAGKGYSVLSANVMEVSRIERQHR